jgi:hypothetical protein
MQDQPNHRCSHLERKIARRRWQARQSGSTNGHDVGAYSASSAGTITIADLELSTGCLLERGRLLSIEGSVLGNGLCGEIGAEDPTCDMLAWRYTMSLGRNLTDQMSQSRSPG